MVLKEFRELELIRMPELMAIRRIWVNDKHEFDDALPRIYERVMGKQFEDPEWIHNENFEYEEWKILQKVCQEMYPDEKLVFGNDVYVNRFGEQSIRSKPEKRNP